MVDLGTLGGEVDIQCGVFLAVEREEQLEMMEKTANQSRGGPRARGSLGVANHCSRNGAGSVSHHPDAALLLPFGNSGSQKGSVLLRVRQWGTRAGSQRGGLWSCVLPTRHCADEQDFKPSVEFRSGRDISLHWGMIKKSLWKRKGVIRV